MTFSNKIYKIVDGENVSLYAENETVLNLYILNNSLKKYNILLNSNKICVFLKQYNYAQIFQLNNNKFSLASNGYITLANENEI